MAWILLIVAGMFEVAMALSLESSDGFRKLGWVLAFLITGGLSFYLLALAMRDLPVGTAYAVWTGVGTVGTALLGIALFQESADAVRLACIGLIVAGIVGLKWFSPAPAEAPAALPPPDAVTSSSSR